MYGRGNPSPTYGLRGSGPNSPTLSAVDRNTRGGSVSRRSLNLNKNHSIGRAGGHFLPEVLRCQLVCGLLAARAFRPSRPLQLPPCSSVERIPTCWLSDYTVPVIAAKPCAASILDPAANIPGNSFLYTGVSDE